MPDIPDDNWSERDERNAENAPNGFPPGLPAQIELIGQMVMGAIKRFWNKINPAYATTGTGDNYVVTPEGNTVFLNLYEIIRVRIDRTNTTTTPTLKFGRTNARVVVKVLGTGIAPLALGDLIAGRDHSFWYNGTNFVLSNPGTVTAAETTGLLKSANNLSDVANAPTSLINLGGMAKATYDPQNINADAFARANQTGTQAQSTIVNLVSDLALKAPLASPALTGNPTAPTQSQGDSSTKLATTAYADAAVSARSAAACRLALSGGNLLLSRFNGLRLSINGAAEIIPQAGVTLSASGLTPSTLYYIYAFMNSGTMTLEASTTVPVADTATGIQIKTGDATRTLVGMARPVTGPAWADTAKQRFVISYFNRRASFGESNFTAVRTTTSATYVEINTEIRVEFLAWGDTALNFNASGGFYNSTANATYSAIGLDGISTLMGKTAEATAASYEVPLSMAAQAIPTIGYHFVTIAGRVGGGTGSWDAANDGVVVLHVGLEV